MFKHMTAVTAALALAAPATASAGFKEPTKVLWQHTGAEGDYFGWAVSPLAAVDGDGAGDVIVGEPGCCAEKPGATWVYSGRTGAPLRRFEGAAGDENGFAIAHAGGREPTRTAARSPARVTWIATVCTTSSAGRPARPPTRRATPSSTPAATARSCTRSAARPPATCSAPPW